VGRTIRLAVITALLGLGCLGEPSPSNDGDAAAGPDGAAPDVAAGCDPQLTYASFGMRFLGTYCGSCHGFNQQSAQQSGSIIAAAAGTGTFMPPGAAAQPSAKERMELVAWIACGAP